MQRRSVLLVLPGVVGGSFQLGRRRRRPAVSLHSCTLLRHCSSSLSFAAATYLVRPRVNLSLAGEKECGAEKSRPRNNPAGVSGGQLPWPLWQHITLPSSRMLPGNPAALRRDKQENFFNFFFCSPLSLKGHLSALSNVTANVCSRRVWRLNGDLRAVRREGFCSSGGFRH